MITLNKFTKNLEKIIEDMKEMNIVKVRSMSLKKVQKDNKVNRSFLKELLDKSKELQKEKSKICEKDFPKNEARFLFQDITEGTVVIDRDSHEMVIGVRL